MTRHRTVAWPMYATDGAAVQAFWSGLRTHLVEAGLADVPQELAAPEDLTAHWLSPDLLLSQTCGYPLVTSLARQVRYVATPCFTAPGCEGAWYRSALVVRQADPADSIVDLRGRTTAFNSRESQSGYNALRALVAPHARAGRFFAGVVETGSHRGSLRAVSEGLADLAAIDAATLAHVSDAAPAECEGLRVLGYTEAAPGLPLITSTLTTDGEVFALRTALARASVDAALAPARAKLRLEGFTVLNEDAYTVIADMRRTAIAAGYPELA